MRQFARSIWNRLRGQARPQAAARRTATRRLELETLEDRTLMTASANGTIAGQVYIDANNSGKIRASDTFLHGVVVDLTGTTTSGHAAHRQRHHQCHGRLLFPKLAARDLQHHRRQQPGRGYERDRRAGRRQHGFGPDDHQQPVTRGQPWNRARHTFPSLDAVFPDQHHAAGAAAGRRQGCRRDDLRRPPC